MFSTFYEIPRLLIFVIFFIITVDFEYLLIFTIDCGCDFGRKCIIYWFNVRFFLVFICQKPQNNIISVLLGSFPEFRCWCLINNQVSSSGPVFYVLFSSLPSKSTNPCESGGDSQKSIDTGRRVPLGQTARPETIVSRTPTTLPLLHRPSDRSLVVGQRIFLRASPFSK